MKKGGTGLERGMGFHTSGAKQLNADYLRISIEEQILNED